MRADSPKENEMVKDGNIYTVALATMSAIYDMDKLPGMTVWELGKVRLSDSTLKELAEAAAKNLGGKLVRAWHDRGAYAEIEVSA